MKNVEEIHFKGFQGWFVELEESDKYYSYYLMHNNYNYRMFMYSLNKKQVKDEVTPLEILKSNLDGFTELYNQKIKNIKKD